MKKQLSKTEAKEEIESFFMKSEFKPEEAKRIKKLAMKYQIRLKENKKRFCRKCYSDLRKGKVRIKDGFKRVECLYCGNVVKWKIKKI